ncbi:MAG: hypothetical protein J7M34_03875, partial [Anaerolineae bacterium]|nr:hypothetical protein [Anaerolineae bacterium]
HTPTPPPTPSPTPTPTATPARIPSATMDMAKRTPRVNGAAFLLGLLATALASIITYALQASNGLALHAVLNTTLWSVILGMGAYILYGLGWLPGATYLQQATRPWGAAAVTLAAGLLPLAIVRVRSFLIKLGTSQPQE